MRRALDWRDHIGATHADGSAHVPDWTTVQHADVSADSPIFDVWCVTCGQSGSFRLTADDIDWI